jgi:hypothetical protein
VPEKDDQDRPWSKRRDGDERDEERPRKKRRDEDEDEERDEERPRKKRRDEDERDEERPQKKRRDDDERDEDRPRRRRDDDEDEDRPRRRRRDDDDDEDDDYDRGRSRKLPRAELRAIAGYQKGIIFCILAQLCVYGALFAIPEDMRLWGALALLPVGIAATVFVFLLATKVYGSTAGVIYAIMTLIPCIGLIMLLVINGKATTIMKEHGIRVGLLGARSSDL